MKKSLTATLAVIAMFTLSCFSAKPANAAIGDVVGYAPCFGYELVIDFYYNPRYDFALPVYGRMGCMFMMIVEGPGCDPDSDDGANSCAND